VGVDHRGRDVAVAQQLLDGADVVTRLEQVGGERVAQGVTGHPFGELRSPGGLLDGALEDGRVQVVPPETRALHTPEPGVRKRPLASE
jgi:hypothetical protein